MNETNPDPKALASAVAQVRRLIAHLRKTKAPREDLIRVEREVAALAALLASHDHPGPYAQATLDVASVVANGGPPLHLSPGEFFPYSPIVGPLNPVAPPIRFDVVALDGRDGGGAGGGNGGASPVDDRNGGTKEIRAEHVFDAPYTGPPGSVHGGIIALAFDELLGCVGAVSNLGGFTGTLTIAYRSFTPIGKPIRMRAWIEGTEGVKTFIKGTMHCDMPAPDTLCAEATGVFIRPKRSIALDALAGTGNR